MEPILYIDRETKQKCEEKVYGAAFLRFLYGNTKTTRFIGQHAAHAIAKIPFLSKWYGNTQKSQRSVNKVIPFIEKFHIDTAEFADPVSSFQSFNDFFIRKLKPEARPIDQDPAKAIIPADGRYLFHPRIDLADGFIVKGQKFSLAQLLQDDKLAQEYAKGSMVMARLCPTDYHRYHFPCDSTPGITQYINGWLYSVNPVAIKKNIDIFVQNKRTLCILDSEMFGKVLFLEIGATFVGAIHQTYEPYAYQPKGAEKGYFSFGGSSLILLFPPNSIEFDADLLEASRQNIEIKCLMGQSMGKAISS